MVLIKKRYNFDFNYMEEAQFPSLRDKWCLIHTEPIWYKMILLGILIETFLIIYGVPMNIVPGTVPYFLFKRFQIVFHIVHGVDIVLYITEHLAFSFTYPNPNPASRPAVVLVLEVIALFPFELIIPVSDPKVYMGLEMIHTLNIFRFVSHVRNNRRDRFNKFTTRFFEVIVFIVAVPGFFIHILYLTNLVSTPDDVYDSYVIAFVNGAGQGYAIVEVGRTRSIYTFELVCIILSITFMCLVIFPSNCIIIVAYVENKFHRYVYSDRVNQFSKEIAPKYKLPLIEQQMVINYFGANWRIRGGYSLNAFGHYLHPSLQAEIATDVCFVAFKHSHLFKDVHFYFLKELCCKMVRHIRMEGEYICRIDKEKIGMIYIQSGVIEVVSSECEDASILQLTTGTCFGELSLFFNHVSPVDLRCKTVCDVLEMSREDFSTLIYYYPKECTEIYKAAVEIIKKAKHIKKLNVDLHREVYAHQRIIWLKYTLHELMIDRAYRKDMHIQSNIYLRDQTRNLSHLYERVVHTHEFLDKLAIQEFTTIDSDIMFVRSKCPWIFNPTSPLIKIWDLFIVIFSIAVAICIGHGLTVEYSKTVQGVSTGAHFIYLVDIIILICTPLNHSTSRNISTILAERLKTVGFYLDLASVFYWKMIYFVINTKLPWYELFKLAKLWRIWNMHSSRSTQYMGRADMSALFYSVVTYMALLYCISCLFAYVDITNQLVTSIANTHTTGAGMHFKPSPGAVTKSYAFVIANMLSAFAKILITGTLCATVYLSAMSKFKTMTLIKEVGRHTCKSKRNWAWYRAHAFFDLIEADNNALSSVRHITKKLELPPHFAQIMKMHMQMGVLQKLKLLEGFSKEMYSVLLADSDLITGHRYAVLVNKGTIHRHLFIVIQGECRTLCGHYYYGTKLLEVINYLECAYDLPALTTTISLSEFVVLKFPYDTFLKVLRLDSSLYDRFHKTVAHIEPQVRSLAIKLQSSAHVLVRARHPDPSFKRFPWYPKKNSFEESDYHVPFDRIKPFDFVKYFLLKVTFMPEGKFYKRYEIAHAVFAIITTFVFSTHALTTGGFEFESIFFPLLLVLDILAFVDIYVRFHVCYYNTDGLLVSHPLFTARYYLSHAFAVDLLSSLPIYLVPLKMQFRAFLKFLHALRLIRLAHLRNYFNRFKFNLITIIIHSTCVTIFFANVCSSLTFIYDCYTWLNLSERPNCTRFQFNEPFNELGWMSIHIHILFPIFSSMQGSGLNGRIVISDLAAWLRICLDTTSFIGLYIIMMHKAQIFCCTISNDNKKFSLVLQMRRLQRLVMMSTENKIICREIAQFYNLHWSKVAAKNVLHATKTVFVGLRIDVLTGFYGNEFYQHCAFSKWSPSSKSFMLNIMLNADPLAIPKRGHIITINDINDDVYILNQGEVDLIAPDGTRMAILTVGAIFGNIICEKSIRHKASFVARVNCLMLKLPAASFFDLLKSYPDISKLHYDILRINMYYIHGLMPRKVRVIPPFKTYVRGLILNIIFKCMWYVYISYCCYFGIYIELYLIAVGEFSPFMLFILLSLDVIHIVYFILMFICPFRDENDMLVMDPKEIRKRQTARKLEMLIMSCVSINLDWYLIIFIVLSPVYTFADFPYVISFLRMNRIVKLYYIVITYRRSQAVLSQCYGYLVKWLYVVYWYLVSLQLIATLTALVDSILSVEKSYVFRNKVPIAKVKNLRNLPPLEKFEMYLRYFYFSSLIHTNSNDINYGPSTASGSIYTLCLFLYAASLNAFVLCGFFQAMIEYIVLRRDNIIWNGFLQLYNQKLYNSFIVKLNVNENAAYYWKKTYCEDDRMIKEVCPRYLREVIQSQLYGYLFRMHPVFQHTHMDFLRQLGNHVTRIVYPCNNVIVNRLENRHSMYFIHSGEVAVYDVDFGYVNIALHRLRRGDSFGFRQGLGRLNVNYNYTYTTISHCIVLELNWDNWKYLLDHFPAVNSYLFEKQEDYENLTHITGIRRLDSYLALVNKK